MNLSSSQILQLINQTKTSIQQNVLKQFHSLTSRLSKQHVMIDNNSIGQRKSIDQAIDRQILQHVQNVGETAAYIGGQQNKIRNDIQEYQQQMSNLQAILQSEMKQQGQQKLSFMQLNEIQKSQQTMERVIQQISDKVIELKNDLQDIIEEKIQVTVQNVKQKVGQKINNVMNRLPLFMTF